MDEPVKPRIKNRSKILERDRTELKRFLLELDGQGVDANDAQRQAGERFHYTSNAMSDFFYKEVHAEVFKRAQEREAFERHSTMFEARQAKERSYKVAILVGLALVALFILGPDIPLIWNSGGSAPTESRLDDQFSPSDAYATCKAKLQPSFESCVADTKEGAWQACKQIFMDAMSDCTDQPR